MLWTLPGGFRRVFFPLLHQSDMGCHHFERYIIEKIQREPL